eukprot:jgi/Chlat1/7435/Chrsp6S07453
MLMRSRALELAINYKTHVDSVLYYRARYLRDVQRTESNARFQQYASQVEIDEAKIKSKIAEEREKEVSRPAGPRRTQ